MAAVNGVILPVMSNSSQTLERQSLLVSFDGIMLVVAVDFCPLFFFSKIHIFNVQRNDVIFRQTFHSCSIYAFTIIRQ